MTQPTTKIDLPTNYFITYNINYVHNHKKFVKGVVVFKIALTAAVISSSILQGNGKGLALNKPLLLELGSLYLLTNDTPKCHLCLSTSYIYADYPLKKTSQFCHNYSKASHLKANYPNPTYNNYKKTSYLKNNCPHITYNQYNAIGHRK